MANGDVEELTAQGSKKCDTIVLTGKQENCDKAKEALLVSRLLQRSLLAETPPPPPLIIFKIKIKSNYLSLSI